MGWECFAPFCFSWRILLSFVDLYKKTAKASSPQYVAIQHPRLHSLKKSVGNSGVEQACRVREPPPVGWVWDLAQARRLLCPTPQPSPHCQLVSAFWQKVQHTGSCYQELQQLTLYICKKLGGWSLRYPGFWESVWRISTVRLRWQRGEVLSFCQRGRGIAYFYFCRRKTWPWWWVQSVD